MEIIFNNEVIEIENNISLYQLLSIFGYKNEKIAVAINQIFIPKILYAYTTLKSQDQIDIVFPMQGG